MAPKREKLWAALESLKQKEMALDEAMRQLQNLHDQLERLQGTYDAKMKEKEDLIRLVSIPPRFLHFTDEMISQSHIKPRRDGLVKEVGSLRPPVTLIVP